MSHSTSRRYFLKSVIRGTAVLSISGCAGALQQDDTDLSNDKPNIILIFVDNVGYGDLGCYGNKSVKTPRIDQLAREGVRCTDFYIASPSCMPSRGALLTGRHAVRNGLNEQIWKIDELKQVGLPHSEKILPQYLAEAGYVSGCFGKWNLGFTTGSRPTDRGFDEYFGNISGNCDYYTYMYRGRNDLYHNTAPAKADGYSTYVFADAACEFIESNKNKPFFCYVPFNAAHFPNPSNKPSGTPCLWQAPDEVYARYGYSPDTLDERQRYRAVLTALDNGIGLILDKLNQVKLTDNSIIIMLSDNGAFMIPARGMECASNYPLRGGGTTLWEGGIRVPCIVRWPGRIKPGIVCREPLVSMDFVPMLLHAAGLNLPGNLFFDGIDPTDALTGQAPSPHKYLYWSWGSSTAAIRMGRYKLLREKQSTNQDWQLFDLNTDIGETANLSSARPELVAHLKNEYERWENDAKTG